MKRTRTVRRRCKFTEADLRRAIRAAQKEGVRARIEITLDDGRISIIPMFEMAAAMLKGPTGPNEWDGA